MKRDVDGQLMTTTEQNNHGPKQRDQNTQKVIKSADFD